MNKQWLEKLLDNKYKLDKIKVLVQSWISKQGHDSCWYYPEIFKEIANLLDLEFTPPELPPKEEFKDGCAKYYREIYMEELTK